uniref:CRAL-TRIO domain-containing protein n=1 Tax=Florenciella parvula TaxID=236787 RepID=A0A7S2BHZ0_9STRA|mmetsp:Transcript_17037/g.35601  ORF Transcript_17037/g.35601 Transcript_17037/m.35601 type:complete len:350 (+) Transcript_17037:281-1330(+)
MAAVVDTADAAAAAAEEPSSDVVPNADPAVWRGVLGDDYEAIQELIDLTDPEATKSQAIIDIYNGVPQDKDKKNKTANEAPPTPPDENTMRRCIEDHRALRASLTNAIRFYHARQGDVPAASRQLARHLLWRAERNMQLEARQTAAASAGEGAADAEAMSVGEARSSHIPRELMEEGSFKAAGRDKQGRPILCVRARLWQPGRFAEADEEEFAMYMLDHIEMKMNGSKTESEWANKTPVGEQWVVLFDMTKWTTANSDIATVKRLIKILVVHYPDRLGMAIIFNAPFLFSAVWAIISPFLEEVTRKKVLFVKNNRDGSVNQQLAAVIDPEDLEEDFGGSHAQYPSPAFV